MSQHRYPPRDRSPPPRSYDRRSSSTYVPTNSSSSYRPANDSTQASIDRLPPRGPRADTFRGGFSSTPRGRGAPFTPRGGDSWDRERDRDVRTQPSTFRRDDDRADWPRRDDRTPTFNRDRPYVGRERSASPIRIRRDSKENISAPFSRNQDAGPSYFGPSSRGASDRGRGRGGWDRSRGRTSFVGDRERDLFPNRSRSREGWREREREFDRPRQFPPDSDRGERFDRREYDRQPDRESRGREHDLWQRDPSPGRSSAGNRAPSPGAMSSISQDRKFDHDTTRKPLVPSNLPPRETRRETDSDYFNVRSEPPRREPTFPQPPLTQAVPQSSSLGLDYGPPPSASTPVAQGPVPEKPAPTVRAMKPDSSPSSPTFQPPSGPKAERSTTSLQAAPQIHPSSQAGEPSRTKVDSTGRPRSRLSDTTDIPSELSKPFTEPTNDPIGVSSVHTDRPLPPNVPSGPRLSSGSTFKAKTSPVAQQSALPVQQKAGASDSKIIPNAPTGPRSSSLLPPLGPRGSLPTGPAGTQNIPASTSWRRTQVEYRPQKPSIMGNMNRSHIPERSQPQSAHPNSRQSPKQSVRQLVETDRSVGQFKPEGLKAPLTQSVDTQEDDPSIDIEMTAQASEDEDVEDDPDSELDENDYANSEEKHAREMTLLKTKLPPPLLQDSSVVRLLIRIQLLDMIAKNLVPETIKAIDDEKDVTMIDTPADGFLSPRDTPGQIHSPILHHPIPRGRPLKELPVNPIPTPPIDELPFLPRSPITTSGVGVFNDLIDDEIHEEEMTTLLRTEFEQQAWEDMGDLEELSEFYRQKFPEWKYEVDKYERVKRDVEATPDPGSPGAQSSVSIPPSAERPSGRAARNATEFDIEKAILMSQQSAREDEERREREAASNAKPNYDTEAVVPDMLKPHERELMWRFEDRNYFVPTKHAIELMHYIPPEDDFTEEEQTKFIAAFCQTPKKWGQIADKIPGRNYQECIAHYYLTKNEANYKEIWRRSQPKRKRGRAATKPRSTALLSDMALNEDPDATPAPVTDSGRPKRAAAPTFGDMPEGEAVALPTAKRLAVGSKDAMESTLSKPTKGRKAGTATKVRRTKAQILADNQALAAQASADGSPLKGASARVRTLMRADNVAPKMETNVNMNVTDVPSMAATASTVASRQEPPPQPVITSYWSVPEQQKFRQLLAYYGRDFAKIAEFMKTKSPAMIKNNYSREIIKGDPDIEKVAQLAEERISRGESTGRLPSPIAPPKRKYDSISVYSGSARPATANSETSAGVERVDVVSKPLIVDDFPANTISRDANGSIVAKPSPRSDLLQATAIHPTAHAKQEDPVRDRPVLAQKPLLGPQRGHFTEDVFQSQSQQRLQGSANDNIPHHHPPTLVELRGDILPSHQRDIFGQNRDSIGNSQSAMQPSGYRSLEAGRPLLQASTSTPSRQAHSRNTSLAGMPPSVPDHTMLDMLALQADRNRHYGLAVSQSPRMASLQPVPSRMDHFSTFSQHQASQQQQQQQQQPQLQTQPPQPAPTVKQEAPKPAKRSNLFDMLNNDEPPERPGKRSSTDSASRSLLQTPPPQSTLTQSSNYHQRGPEPLAPRPTAYTQPPSSLSETRNAYSNSPVPVHRPQSWIEKFDPRPTTDRASNLSPLYAPSVPSSASKPLIPGMADRGLDVNVSRRGNLGRPSIASPPVQNSTPVQQFRSSSAAPQHSRMSSVGYGQAPQLAADHRLTHQQSHQSSSQHVQQPSTHAPVTSGTPVSSVPSRVQQSGDYDRRGLTIQQYKAQSSLDQSRDSRDFQEHRIGRDEILPRGGHDHQHRHIAQAHESLRQAPIEHRDSYRSDPTSHQVPPPPQRSSQLSHITPNFGGPPRSYNNTPPQSTYGSDARGMATTHNQHVHQHHHSLSAHGQPSTQQQAQQQQAQQQQQGQGQGSQVIHHHHLPQHHHQQSSMGLPSQSHQGIAPHNHQSQAVLHQQQQQQQQQQSSFRDRYGQPQSLIPPPQSHYRNYSQSGDDRR